MAKPNYSFEKRRKEMEKKRKKEEKKQRKLESAQATGTEEPGQEESASEPT